MSATSSQEIEVPDNLFGAGRRSHQFKEATAWTVLSKDMRLLAKGVFDPKVFDPRVFATEDAELSHSERLRSLFVDYKDGVVTLGATSEKQKVDNIIERISREIAQCEARTLTLAEQV